MERKKIEEINRCKDITDEEIKKEARINSIRKQRKFEDFGCWTGGE